jgi:hypothetical protein
MEIARLKNQLDQDSVNLSMIRRMVKLDKLDKLLTCGC